MKQFQEELKNIKINFKQTSPNSTKIIYHIPANFWLIIANLALPLYLLTEQIFLSLAILATIYLYAKERTKLNQNWTKNLKQTLIFRLFLALYVMLIAGLLAKIYLMF